MSELKQRKKGADEASGTSDNGPEKSPGERSPISPVNGVPVKAALKSAVKETPKDALKSWNYPIQCSNAEIYYKLSLAVVTILALATRFWMIHNPGEVVFDEVHFGKFASFYLRGEYYFDVHPPLAKLILAGVGYMVGYDGHFLFETIGLDYAENNVPYIAFRLWCALCGALVIPFAFLIMKEMGVSVIACTLGALLLVFGIIHLSR